MFLLRRCLFRDAVIESYRKPNINAIGVPIILFVTRNKIARECGINRCGDLPPLNNPALGRPYNGASLTVEYRAALD